MCCKMVLLEMEQIGDPVIWTATYIRRRGLNHRQFGRFVEEAGSEVKCSWVKSSEVERSVVRWSGEKWS